MDATETVQPKRSHKKKEFHTSDVTMEQKSTLNIGLADTPFVRPDPDICVSEQPLETEHEKALAFNEQPVKIICHEPANERFPAQYVDCWVNGKGIEVWHEATHQWLELKAIPFNEPVIVKRKYAEVLLKSKTESIKTDVTQRPGEDPTNFILRSNAARCPITILEDKDPRGREWAARMVGMILN